VKTGNQRESVPLPGILVEYSDVPDILIFVFIPRGHKFVEIVKSHDYNGY